MMIDERTRLLSSAPCGPAEIIQHFRFLLLAPLTNFEPPLDHIYRPVAVATARLLC